MFKKIISILCTCVFIISTLVTPAFATNMQASNEWLLEKSQKEADFIGFSSMEAKKFSILENKENTGYIDITFDEGNSFSVEKSNLISVPYVPSTDCTLEFSEKEKKIIDKSKKLILEFVDNAQFINSKDKPGLKKYINSVKFQLTEFDNTRDWADAIYDNSGTVFVGTEGRKYLSTWMISHELLHAVNDYLSDDEWLETGTFVEAMTDVLTASIFQSELKSSHSGYYPNHDYAYAFINTFGTEGIKAFLYCNYTRIGIPKAEIELLVYSMNCFSEKESQSAKFIAREILLNWRDEKAN